MIEVFIFSDFSSSKVKLTKIIWFGKSARIAKWKPKPLTLVTIQNISYIVYINIEVCLKIKTLSIIIEFSSIKINKIKHLYQKFQRN